MEPTSTSRRAPAVLIMEKELSTDSNSKAKCKRIGAVDKRHKNGEEIVNIFQTIPSFPYIPSAVKFIDLISKDRVSIIKDRDIQTLKNNLQECLKKAGAFKVLIESSNKNRHCQSKQERENNTQEEDKQFNDLCENINKVTTEFSNYAQLLSIGILSCKKELIGLKIKFQTAIETRKKEIETELEVRASDLNIDESHVYKYSEEEKAANEILQRIYKLKERVRLDNSILYKLEQEANLDPSYSYLQLDPEKKRMLCQSTAAQYYGIAEQTLESEKGEIERFLKMNQDHINELTQLIKQADSLFHPEDKKMELKKEMTTYTIKRAFLTTKMQSIICRKKEIEQLLKQLQSHFKFTSPEVQVSLDRSYTLESEELSKIGTLEEEMGSFKECLQAENVAIQGSSHWDIKRFRISHLSLSKEEKEDLFQQLENLSQPKFKELEESITPTQAEQEGYKSLYDRRRALLKSTITTYKNAIEAMSSTKKDIVNQFNEIKSHLEKRQIILLDLERTSEEPVTKSGFLWNLFGGSLPSKSEPQTP